MNYNQVVEESVYKKYITHGINENIVATSVTEVSGDSNGAVWNAIDVTFSNGESDLRARFFEFKYRPAATDAKGVIIDEKTQEINYLKKMKHLFSKIADSPEAYDMAMANAKDWSSFVAAIRAIVAGSKKFRLICIDNGKGFPKIPDWNSGFAESMDVNPTKLKFDSVKYGKKVKPEEAVEKVAPAADDLPF